MKPAACILLAAAAASVIAAVPLEEDPPVAKPPTPGDMSGRIRSDRPIASLTAVCRGTGKRYRPAGFNATTGEFLFRRLPGDASYDLCLKIGARTVEGIDLRFVDARMLRLASLRRRQLKLPPEREHAFAKADADEILKWIANMKDFMEIRRVLYLRGAGTRATVLVELLRTREFHADKGQVVWRVELWHFRESFGGWQRLPRQQNVLRRERLSPADWRKIHLEYYPQLSVYVDEKGTSGPVKFTVPKPDLSRGRLPNTSPRVKTPTHILGLLTSVRQ
jgi:hypothetical protein